MELLAEYGLFLAKTFTLVLALLIVAGGLAAVIGRGRVRDKGHLKIRDLNRHYDGMAHALRSAVLDKKAFKRTLKEEKRRHKAERKKSARKRKLFVLNFHGDIRASGVASLREEITAVLAVAEPEDEVILRLESAGGLVHAYGLAASQLTRIKQQNVPLTVAVDKVAASGGYMMACVADRIIAAPFAVVGSIGVLSQLPNLHRWLKAKDIDFEQFTAGEYKRTVTLFGENTEKDREKFQQEIEETHALFKDFIKQHRGQLDLDRIATGEHWYGTQALELELVDALLTSDDYLLEASRDAALFEVSFVSRKRFASRFFPSTARAPVPAFLRRV